MKNLKVLSVFLFLLAISPLSGQQINYPYTNVGVSGVVAGTPGTPITVAGSNQTIAPTSLVTDIGGTGSIQTITPPAGFTASLTGCLAFNATAAWTTVTGGNIANAITATANTSYQACYDGATFYISGSGGGGGGAVSSVANSDSTLTISPTTGSVIASLNLAHANTWSAAQTFNALDIFSAGFNLSGTTAPLELAGSAGTSGNCLLSGGAGTTPSWGSCGGSGVTWPATNDLVISNSTNTPTGLAPVNGDCVIGSGGVWVAGSCGGGSSVSSVANSDSTLTISPTTGSVVASLNLAHANTWTAAQALGSSTATTQSLGDNTTKLATDAFVLANGGGQPLGCQSITASSNAVTVNWQSGGCVDINANGAAITSFTFQNPVIGAYYYIGFCNDATARSWSSVPGTFLQAATPQYGSECQRKVYEYTTAGNYQGTGSNATPSIQYGLERSAPATLAAGSFVSWWDSTAHLLCNLDNGSSTENCTTPNGTSGDLVDYNSSGYTQDSGTLLSNVVTLAGSQTLTNKTLTTPTVNSASLSGTLSGTPTFSGLDVFSAGFNLSGTTAPLELAGSAGTSGNCLISGGASTTPSWGSCGTGAGITLTTVGSSGAATLVGTVLNVPVYTAGGGWAPTNRTVTSAPTIATTDCGNTITVNDASAWSVTLPQATGSYAAGTCGPITIYNSSLGGIASFTATTSVFVPQNGSTGVANWFAGLGVATVFTPDANGNWLVWAPTHQLLFVNQGDDCAAASASSVGSITIGYTGSGTVTCGIGASAYNFSTKNFTFPANFFSATTSVRIVDRFASTTGGTAETSSNTIQLGGTTVLSVNAKWCGGTISITNCGGDQEFFIDGTTAAGSSVRVAASVGGSGALTNTTSTAGGFFGTAIATNGTLALTQNITYTAASAGNYTDLYKTEIFWESY